jgi:hypothetical protein
MPGLYSSHGTTVSFNGTNIGYLTGFDVEAKAGQLSETTNVTSTVVGSGANARVVKEYDCTSVEPPTVSITFHGPPSYDVEDAGFKATLVFDAPGMSVSGEAILLSWNHSGRSNQWSTGSATFQLTGN